jgi:hypothetical protein
MAKIQKWSITIEDETHFVEYTPCSLFSKASIKINGKDYPLLNAKPFAASNEVFRLGSDRAIISIDARQKATLTVEGEEIKEI